MGREVRRVPADWQHPKESNGRYRPLHGGSFSKSAKEWEEAAAKWTEGLRDDYQGGWKPLEGHEPKTYAEWAGERPVETDYMPDWPEAERTHYMMYEDTSEGTPISPAFETAEKLARWLTDTGASSFGTMTATYEGWLRVCNGGFAPSRVMGPGIGLVSGVDGLT